MDEWVVISHPDGRRVSVTRATFGRLYEPKGFAIEHPESEADFVVAGVPKPKAPRKRPARKAV